MKDVEVFVKQVDKAIDQLQGICTGIDNWGDALTLNEIKEDIKANVLNNLIKSSYTMHRKMEDNNYVKLKPDYLEIDGLAHEIIKCCEQGMKNNERE